MTQREWMNRQILEELPHWGEGEAGKGTGELAEGFELENDEMRRRLEKLRREGKVRRLPRGGYVWFRR